MPARSASLTLLWRTLPCLHAGIPRRPEAGDTVEDTAQCHFATDLEHQETCQRPSQVCKVSDAINSP